MTLASAAEQDAFSHRKHAPLKLKCAGCHKEAESADRAGFPAVTQCRTCHTEMADRTIPARRVYEVPDFVSFSHARHIAAKIACAGCHGDVLAQDAVQAAQPVKMKWCIDCHKQQKAAVGCNTCHELGQ